MNIPIILGTAREGRQSEKAANYMLQQAKEALTELKDGLNPEAQKLISEVL